MQWAAGPPFYSELTTDAGAGANVTVYLAQGRTFDNNNQVSGPRLEHAQHNLWG